MPERGPVQFRDEGHSKFRRRIARVIRAGCFHLSMLAVLVWLLGAVANLRWSDYLTGKDATLHSSYVQVGGGFVCVMAHVRVAPPDGEADWPPIAYQGPAFRAWLAKPRWDTLIFAQSLDVLPSPRVDCLGFHYVDMMQYSTAVPTRTKDLYFFMLVVPLYPFGILGLLFLTWRLMRQLRRRRAVTQRGFPVEPR